MAVVTLYMSDRDPEKRMFTSKKEADEHDKKLELAENLMEFILQHVDSVEEATAERLGMLIADNKELMLQALKGKPQVLLETSGEDKEDGDEKVVSLG